MENIYTFLVVGIYMVSFWLVNCAAKMGHDAGKLTLIEYKQCTILGFIPVVNTVILLTSFVLNVSLKVIHGK